MKQLIFSIFLSAISISSFGQSTQNGRIAEYNGKKAKTPLANVEIKVKNAGSNVSDKKGKFTLSFRTLKPGDKIDVVSILKDGYEIFNKDALDSWRIANDGSTFTVVLCKSVSFKKLKDLYNAVASKSYAQQKAKDEAKLAALLKEGKLKQAEYEKQLKALKDKYDEQLENLDNYIDQFARIDLSELSSQEQKIIEMVQAGKIDEAIKAYEDMKLEDKYAQAVQNINVATDAIKQLEDVKNQNAKAKEQAYAAVKRMNDARRLQGGTENFEKIGNSLKAMLSSDTTNVRLMEEYADFTFDQNLYKETIKYLLKSVQYDTDVENNAVSFQRLGELYNRMRNPIEASKCLEKAVAILESLQSREFTTKNADRLVGCYISLGSLASINNNVDDAIKYYLLADKITKEINDTTYKSKHAHYTLLANLGSVYMVNLKNFSESIKYSEEALPLAQECYLISNNLEDLFSIHSIELNLFSCYAGCHNDTIAIRYKDMAEKSYSILIEKNPQAYRDKGIIFYNQIAVYYQQHCQYQEMADNMLKAYHIAEQCYKDQPVFVYKIYMVVIRGNYSTAIANIKGREKEALELAQQSCSEMEQMYHKAPEMLKGYYAINLSQLAYAQNRNGEYAKAIENIDKAKELTPDDPDIYYTKGEIYLRNGKYNDALAMWNKVMKLNPNYLSETFQNLRLYNELKAKGYIKE